MTRKEAINELEILKENYWDDDGYGHETKQYDDTMLALDMAIKALEQESKIYEPQEFGIRMTRSEKTVYLLGNDSKAIQEVISTVHKYKKIQEIMDSRPDDDAKANSKALGDIEVVMSCNVDNNQSEKEYLTTFGQPH